MKVRLKTMSIIYGFYNTLREHYASANQTTRCVIRFAFAAAFATLLMASVESILPVLLASTALYWGMYLRLCVLGGASIRGNFVRLLIMGGICNLISNLGCRLISEILLEALRWPQTITVFIGQFAITYLTGRLFAALFLKGAAQKSCS